MPRGRPKLNIPRAKIEKLRCHPDRYTWAQITQKLCEDLRFSVTERTVRKIYNGR